MMKIWVVKYALTRGIFSTEADIDDAGFAIYREKSGYKNYLHGEGREWCRSEAEALKVAEMKRAKKLASLSVQIGKIEMLKFPVADSATP